METFNGESMKKTTMIAENELMKTKPGKYQKLLKEFSQESSAGGINKIFSSKPVLIRSIWVVLCIVCYGAMVYLSFAAVKTFFSKPTSTFIDVSFETVINKVVKAATERCYIVEVWFKKNSILLINFS